MAKAHDGTQELDQQGAYKRTDSIFRKFIGSPEFPAESGRYHLYVSYACPWASRCLAVRALKGLEDCISISVVAPLWDETKPGVDEHRGWVFKSAEEVDGCIPDDVNGYKTVRDIYEAANDTLGKYSVPILWDKKSRTIVNNESSEIIRMFSSDFNEFAKHPKVCLFPEELRADIEAVNEFVYPCINNGVYRAGFATAQAPYEHAVNELFGALDRCEEILSKQRFLAGARLTEADIRLFVTLVRFDEVYVGHFKCNRRRIMDYDNLLNFTREVYQIPGIAATVNMKHIKDHYHGSHKSINKYGIIPVGPAEGTDFTVPHNRDRFPLVPFDAPGPQTGK